MRRRLLAVVLAAVAALVASGTPAPAQVSTPEAEAAFVARVNGLRAARGLGALSVHGELTSVARAWAAKMAAANRISHNPNLANQVQAPWTKLGENVGLGMTVDDVHNAFVASPSHLKNIVDGAFGYIGVGVAVGRDGALFTAHTFMQLGAAPTPPTTARRPPPAPATTSPPRPPPTTPPTPTPTSPPPPPPPPPEPVVTEPPPPEPVAAVAPPRLVLVLGLLGELDSA